MIVGKMLNYKMFFIINKGVDIKPYLNSIDKFESFSVHSRLYDIYYDSLLTDPNGPQFIMTHSVTIGNCDVSSLKLTNV